MGISNLLPHIRDAQQQTHIQEFSGQRIAIDTYVWLHKGAFFCAEELATNLQTSRFKQYSLSLIRLLQAHGITPVMVFDGGQLPSKAATESKRAKARAENLVKAKAFKQKGMHQKAVTHYKSAFNISTLMARSLQDELDHLGIEYIVAPYEADSELAYLAHINYVDAIVTEDSDLLLYGIRKPILYKLTSMGDCASFSANWLTRCKELNLRNWRADQELRLLGVLIGCDYFAGVKGLGIKKAHRLISQHMKPGQPLQVEQIIKQLLLDKTFRIPENFEEHVNLALLTFQHQRVYCPIQKRIVHRIPINQQLSEKENNYVGKHYLSPVAQKVAHGLLDPVTHQPFPRLSKENIKPFGIKLNICRNTKNARK